MPYPNAFPFEVIGSPFDFWVAPAGTARPVISAAPAVAWVQLGNRGKYSFGEEGVRVNSPASYNYFRSYGSAAPIKAFRSEEDVMFQTSLADLSLEHLANAFNQLAGDVTEAGITRTLNLARGLSVLTAALLMRGPSPYMDGGTSQFWVPNACNVSSPEIAVRRDNATIYSLEWRAVFYSLAAAGEEMGVYEAEVSST
jgi:hypothetical protein